MRERIPLLIAAGLAGIVVALWTMQPIAFSVTPGWHTLVFSPLGVVTLAISAALLVLACGIVVTHLVRRRRTPG